MEYLDLGDNRITNIGSLKNVTGISYLNLSGNRIIDISPFSNLNGSYSAGSKVANVSGFVLHLENNQISDISYLPLEVKYWRLSLYGNSIIDLGRLAELSYTRTGTYERDGIYLSYSDKLDITPLEAGSCQSFHFTGVPLDWQASWEAVNVDGLSKSLGAHFYEPEEFDELVKSDKLQTVQSMDPGENEAAVPEEDMSSG